MTWPNVLPNSAAFDSDADSVAASRPELKKMSDAVNILASNVYTGLATSGTVTPDAANGEIQVVTLSGNMTINAFANPIAGQIIKIVFKQPAAGSVFNLSSTIPFENGNESLTPLNSAVDMATITFDGTNYYGLMLNAFGTNEVYPFEFNVVGDDSSGHSLQLGSIGGSTLQFVGTGGTTVSVGAGPVVTIDAGGGGGSPLAADFDVNNFSIVNNVTNGHITLTPNGTGDVRLNADTVRVGDSNANATITTNGTGDLILNTNAGTNSGTITIQDATNGNIVLDPNGTGDVRIPGSLIGGGYDYPLKLSSTTEDTGSPPSYSSPAITSDRALYIKSTGYAPGGGGTYGDVIVSANSLTIRQGPSPTTPAPVQLSAGVDSGQEFIIQCGNASKITMQDSTLSGNISITTGATTGTFLLENFREKVHDWGDQSGSIPATMRTSVSGNGGTIQKIRLTGNSTLSGTISSIQSGQTLTYIIEQDGTGSRTLTFTGSGTWKFAGGVKTLSTAANAVDILTISYVGTTYYASLNKGFVV